MFPAKPFKGSKVAVLGLARSGLACALALQKAGAELFAWDDSKSARTQAIEAGLSLKDLKGLDFTSLHSLVLSPGIPLTHPKPHWSVEAAQASGTEVIGDTEVFARSIEGTGATIVGITGTNGKSTTTALIAHVLTHAGLDAHAGGNIGNAVFNLPEPVAGRIYVVELSSYQIDLMPGLKPKAGVLLNLSPDHLDRHGSMERYAGVKARMFALQDADDTAVICVDDKWCADIAVGLTVPKVRQISLETEPVEGISARDGLLVERIGGMAVAAVDLSQAEALRGRHNWQNAAAAYAVARSYDVQPDLIAAGFATFPGLKHRMEQVARRGNVIFVNDSKATNTDAAQRALDSFENIFWIAGGRAKDGGIAPLEHWFRKISKAYLIGEAAGEFARELQGKVQFQQCGTMAKAVEAAIRDASGEEASGEVVVLLSPACASFDQYKDFEERGDDFRRHVARLLSLQPEEAA